MADDDNNGPEEITNEAARGALAGHLAATAVGMSLIGSASQLSHPTKEELAGGTKPGGISAAEMKTWQEWADKAPGLIRGESSKVEAPEIKSAIKFPLIALGVVAGIASFTKWVPGKWKILSGGVTVASLAGGFHAGSKANQMNVLSSRFAGETKNVLREYAAALERDPALRKQLAEFLAANMTGVRVENASMEEAVTAASIQFGTNTPYLNPQALERRLSLASSR